MVDKTFLKVRIRDTENILFDGDADRITSFNEMGEFDVFPMHANFISIISKSINIYSKGKIVKNIKIERAVMKVKKDIVQIFLGIESLILDDDNSFKKFDN